MPKRKAPKGTFWRGSLLWGRIQTGGRDVKWSLRTDDPEIAKRRVKEARERAIAIHHYGDARRSVAELLEVWEQYIVRHVSPKTALRYAVSLGQLQPFLDGLYLDEINGALVAEIIRGRSAQKVSNATIRRDLVALSSVIGYAIDQGWREDNPVLTRMSRIKERRDPIVLPEADDIQKVIARAPGMFAKLIEAAWLTGCRLNELVSAKRSQVDHARKQFSMRGKGNKVRVIDLDDRAFELFQSLPPALGKAWLFWHHQGEPYRTASGRFKVLVKSVAKQAQKQEQQFQSFRFHDLRHRHAVDWLKSGRSIYDLQQRLGHTSVKTTEIYLAFLTPEEKRQAMFSTKQKQEQIQEHEQRSEIIKSGSTN